MIIPYSSSDGLPSFALARWAGRYDTAGGVRFWVDIGASRLVFHCRYVRIVGMAQSVCAPEGHAPARRKM